VSAPRACSGSRQERRCCSTVSTRRASRPCPAASALVVAKTTDMHASAATFDRSPPGGAISCQGPSRSRRLGLTDAARLWDGGGQAGPRRMAKIAAVRACLPPIAAPGVQQQQLPTRRWSAMIHVRPLRSIARARARPPNRRRPRTAAFVLMRRRTGPGSSAAVSALVDRAVLATGEAIMLPDERRFGVRRATVTCTTVRSRRRARRSRRSAQQRQHRRARIAPRRDARRCRPSAGQRPLQGA
jgi:hypothetical protein